MDKDLSKTMKKDFEVRIMHCIASADALASIQGISSFDFARLAPSIKHDYRMS